NRESERSEGSGANWALTKDRARTGSIKLSAATCGPDLNEVRVRLAHPDFSSCRVSQRDMSCCGESLFWP
ncbi:MAG: hypothetical protein ACLQVJ_26235, partial [Syntrophobacteraceae bacterium]